MKALQIKGYGDIQNNLEFNEIEKPKIKANEVLIEVYAAAVNPIDYKIVEGALKMAFKLSFPAPMGHDVSGIVVEKGQDVKHLNVGDEVFSVASGSRGSFAEYIALDSEIVHLKPSNLNFNEASSLPLVGLTSIISLKKAKIKEGDKILIHAGSGGVGSFAIQYAKSKGAFVYTTTSTSNVSWVKNLGADRVIDYKKENYLEILSDIDIVFDTLGGDYTLDAFKVIKQGGRVVSVAGSMDQETAKELKFNGMVRLILAFMRRKITKQIKKKSAFYNFIMMLPNREELEEIKNLVESNKIKVVIDKTYPFANAIDALIHQKTGRAKGKVVIQMK